MLEMLVTVGIVLLIIIVIALIISVFANISLGTPTPINLLVKPISNKIGEMFDDNRILKRAAEQEKTKIKSVKTYELNKTKDKVHELGKEEVKTKTPIYERTIINEEELTKGEDKGKTLKK